MANTIHLNIAHSTSQNPQETRHTNLFHRAVGHCKARCQASKIMKGLDEAKKIHSGKIKAQSFDEFLAKF